MSFVHKKLQIKLSDGDDFNLVWERELGDLVIVVLDDYWDYVLGSPNALNPLIASLAQLRLRACELPETQAIGFFVLPEKPEDADKVLLSIQKWLNDITVPDHDIRVCFIVDALYGPEGYETVEPSNYIIEKLANLSLTDCTAYLTQAGEGAEGLRPGYQIFSKADETTYARTEGVLSPELRSFLGLHWHEDEIINDAIKFYAKAWEANWRKQGWDHNELQDKDSNHLKALAEWLDVSIDELYESPDEGESAKSLMIWVGENLLKDRRPIQGKILEAVLKKLGIPLSTANPIPSDKMITIPCTPCFPFLVSLCIFSWHCANEPTPAPITEVSFLQNEENPQKNIFRLSLCLQDPDKLRRKFNGEIRAGALTNALKALTFCKMSEDELMGGERRDYMPLFTKGTENQVVEVKICKDHIDLIWQC